MKRQRTRFNLHIVFLCVFILHFTRRTPSRMVDLLFFFHFSQRTNNKIHIFLGVPWKQFQGKSVCLSRFQTNEIYCLSPFGECNAIEMKRQTTQRRKTENNTQRTGWLCDTAPAHGRWPFIPILNELWRQIEYSTFYATSQAVNRNRFPYFQCVWVFSCAQYLWWSQVAVRRS